MVNKHKLFLLFFIIFIVVFFINFSTAQIDYNFTYDNNGNLIQGFGKYYEYNPFNQLERVRDINSTGRILVEYSYDSDGNRLLKKEFFIGGTNQSTYYIGDNFVQIRNSSGIFNFTYYYDGHDLVAEKTPGGQIRYYHPDHLGSTTLITNGTGAIVEETFYLPYGDVIEGGNNSRYLFTGKERDNETQLYYYGSRYYSSFFSHFIQPDSVLPDVYDPQQLNRYAYARDNPYSYTDPSGNFINIAVGAAVGGFIAAVTDLYRQVVLGQQLTAGQVLKDVGIGVISGAVAVGTFGLAYPALGGGALAGIGAGTTAGVASGESGLIASSVLNNNIGMLTDPIVQAKTVAYGGVIGAVFGGIEGAISSSSFSVWRNSNAFQTIKGKTFNYPGKVIQIGNNELVGIRVDSAHAGKINYPHLNVEKFQLDAEGKVITSSMQKTSYMGLQDHANLRDPGIINLLKKIGLPK